MAKITNPVRFSTHFKVAPEKLTKLGVLDPTLNADTRLFIDPFLITDSAHPEISHDGRATYERHFRQIIGLLRGSKQTGDTPWRNAKRLLQFPEIKWTCLGYGGQSVSGSGSGPFTTDGLIQTAKEIVDLGVIDPDLFVAMGVFEEGVGPDRISDMATNVILPDLLKFNDRILKALGVPVQPVTLTLKNGNSYKADLPINPYEKAGTPIMFVPADILRHLPIVDGRVLVEIKLSTNSKVLAGYEKQLQTYKNAEQTTHGFYVVIDVGRMGRKAEKLLALKNRAAKVGKPTSEIVLVDAKRRPSASKLV